jgi:putative acetyltransferase
MIEGLRIVEDDLSGEAIAGLLRWHIEELHRLSPPESCHVMPIDRLRQPDVTFWSAWDGAQLAGCGALKRLDALHGEIKSMRAAAAYLGKGVGKAILLHLVGEARARGYRRLSLETGTIDEFIPAQRLYAANGFVPCPPFADYRLDPLSLYLTRAL